ncbi:MAG: hypothetical protein FJZ01_28140 [Candidatus Sericytochromatia bacterium]|nr:hypothetical protein [Candidatus Tanganyikabacteria bacterium]
MADLATGAAVLWHRAGMIESSVVGDLFVGDVAAEAIGCDRVLQGNVAGFVPSNERGFVGLILLAAPRSVDLNPHARMEIGIDFGTTNTAVAFRLGDVEAEPAKFADRLRTPLEQSDRAKAAYRNLAANIFLPAREATIPFLSMVQDRRQHRHEDRHVALVSSQIRFHRTYEAPLREVQNALHSNDVRFDLKWSTATGDRELVGLFIGQIAMLGLAEAFGRGVGPESVTWRFSYPEAYGGQHLQDFKAVCARSVEQALGRAGEGGQAPAPQWERESLSAALYFARRMSVPMTESTVTLDIGGRTTDVSIWNAQRLAASS